MDHGNWRATQLLHELFGTAWKQLGTSGSGNHFVEWGLVYFDKELNGVESNRHYVALLSHSGSRGAGAKVCRHYTKLAKKINPAGELSWLDLCSGVGQEYWMSMNLMGEYAAANHQCIHEQVLRLAGLNAITHVENHHNFAWKEIHDGEELIVHRKGATPAAEGELGVIPGSMASPAFIVRGKGNPDSINSASHGAGRAMSRKAAKEKFSWDFWRAVLKTRGVRLLAGGLDEVPGSYKPIEEVMDAQSELVDTVGQFYPSIVMMCGDGSRPED
jgi:tRNA-splicing ligase RtcB